MTASADPGAGAEVVYLVRSWPRLSQTFVLDEVLGLQQIGVRLRLVALERSGERQVQPEVAQTAAPVQFLDHVPGRLAHLRAAAASPVGYLRAVWQTARHPEWDDGYHVAGRWQCLTLATRLAGVLRRDAGPVHVHAHFAHDPAAVALLTHLLTGLPWSFTGHARDVWQVPGPALADRVRSARFTVTCNRAVADHLRATVPPPLAARVRLVHHGVDVQRFRPVDRPALDGRPLRIVSVGRLVPKKGFDDLLEALRVVVEQGGRFRCTIYGDGPQRAGLAEQVARLGLSAAVCLAGPRTRDQLVPALQQADLFALTPHVTSDGDRDGIPNVVVEAMACGLPVVATTTGGIPEIILDGHNGLLAAPRAVPDIARQLVVAMTDEALRARLGAAARRTAVEGFDVRAGAAAMAALFDGGG